MGQGGAAPHVIKRRALAWLVVLSTWERTSLMSCMEASGCAARAARSPATVRVGTPVILYQFLKRAPHLHSM
jgi:hypothetical protein